MEKKTVTVWSEYFSETKKYKFNHIEDGWSEKDKPEPFKDNDGNPFQTQLNWAKQEWRKEHAWLMNGVVTKK